MYLKYDKNKEFKSGGMGWSGFVVFLSKIIKRIILRMGLLLHPKEEHKIATLYIVRPSIFPSFMQHSYPENNLGNIERI
jgi:hypothetical protein